MLLMSDSEVSLRKLDVPVPAQKLKKVVYLFNQESSGRCEIEINEIDGRSVMLRGPADELDSSWEVLQRIATEVQCSSQDGSDEHSKGIVRKFSFNVSNEYFRPSNIVDSEHVRRYEDGRLYLTGEAAQLLDAVDRMIVPFIQQEQATYFYAEPVWHEEELERFGYPANAKDLCKVGHFDENMESAGGKDYWQNATCDNIWKSLANASITKPKIFTTIGTCCRNETRNYYFLERLKTFRMREIVMAGDAESVLAFRERAIEFVGTMAEKLCLNAFLEQANDPFFLQDGVTVEEAPTDLDLPECVKFEFRPELYDGKSVACASFNVHGNFFSKGFKYSNPEGKKVWTSCAAFGIERWVWALLIQHGPDSDHWPMAIKDLLS